MCECYSEGPLPSLSLFSPLSGGRGTHKLANAVNQTSGFWIIGKVICMHSPFTPFSRPSFLSQLTSATFKGWAGGEYSLRGGNIPSSEVRPDPHIAICSKLLRVVKFSLWEIILPQNLPRPSSRRTNYQRWNFHPRRRFCRPLSLSFGMSSVLAFKNGS